MNLNREMKKKSKENNLMLTIKQFYSNKNNINIIIPIIERKSRISLRILDWFTTNYSRENNINYMITEDDKLKMFVVYFSYKDQLKIYNKKMFDPFCRGVNINFEYSKNKFIITTIGQLNFFRWVIKNDIIKYITEHFDEIENDMNHIYKTLSDTTNTTTNTKTRRKITSVLKSNNNTDCKSIVEFL